MERTFQSALATTAHTLQPNTHQPSLLTSYMLQHPASERNICSPPKTLTAFYGYERFIHVHVSLQWTPQQAVYFVTN